MALSYFSTKDESLCSGCSACASSCPSKAIRMTENAEGFLFPTIDAEACTQCGLCEKRCPIASSTTENTEEGQQCFLAVSERQEYFLKSATIGVCTMLSELVIKEGGCVYGVKLDEKRWKAEHTCISRTEDLDLIKNSKYIQSDPNTSFAEVKRKLTDGILVLYVGTPCQIAGLKSYLHHPYKNLLTIDLICHGIYSHKLLKKEVAYWEHRLHGKISNFKFRSKKGSGGIINFDLQKGSSLTHYEFPGKYSPTYRSYAYSGDGRNYNLRKNCYSCSFRSPKRYGDITVGDAWFIDAAKYLNKQIDWKNGVSLILCNTLQGRNYFQKIASSICSVEIPTEIAFSQPALLPSAREIPEQRDAIYQAIDTEEDYAKIVNRLLHADVEKIYKQDHPNPQMVKIKNTIKRFLLINKYKKLKSRILPGWEWWFTNSFLYNFPSKRFRNHQLKRMGMTFKGDARIYAGFHIRNPKGIVLENGVSIGPKVLLDGRMGLTIKEGAVIGYGAIIWTLNHDYNDIHFCGKGAPVTIGRHAWVCSNSIILPGITIGEGAVVASGAIVTHDVPPFCVVGGVPAKVIGQRENKEYDYGYKASTDHYHFC